MKKIIALALTVVMCMSFAVPAFAAEYDPTENESVPSITFLDDSGYVISTGVVTDEEAEADLPEELLAAINSAEQNSGISTYGTRPPSESSVWDLSDEMYYFEANFRRGYIYSNYVFTGHGGGMLFNCRDASGESGIYSITVYVKRGNGFTTYASGAMRLNNYSAFIVEDLNPNDIVYFSLYSPEGKLVSLMRSYTYLMMY